MDFERLQKFYNFFVANDEATARAINAKGEQVEQWVRGAVNSKALAYIDEAHDTRQTLRVLPIESTALTKYGEKELAWRDSLGEMDSMIGAHFGTTSLVDVSFVLHVILRLARQARGVPAIA
ncbi:hypothetical protein PR003_g14047 [Phytophthora rubi]|uniref:Uncharacterized protein n=1 Tax=Phytophthora rubi TaxID=129364 RepID=A0A6A3MKQ0_9STRA|nr:hypothetical protein PR001_g10799 [Phytophthora rubi]KAE9333390.1 hypothetical protein PR003_g14047 [Phytophthora rubi]